MEYIPGIDVSHWQQTVDWDMVAAAGIRYAFIKATEGTNFIDDFFAPNWHGAKQAGILRGAYHFFHPKLDPKTQAKKFLSIVQLEPGDLPLVLDLEIHEDMSSGQIVNRSKIFLEELANATGRKPILYSSPSFLGSHFAGQGGNPPAWTKEYILWIANYLEYQPGRLPFIPKGWHPWTFWQHSASGRVAGIVGNVDLNWFDGTLEKLFQIAGHTGAPVAPPPAVTIHNVLAGETLNEIAARFNVSLLNLVLANPNLLQPGMALSIPQVSTPGGAGPGGPAGGGAGGPPADGPGPGAGSGADTPALEFYIVKAGDTLTSIAARFGVTVARLIELNNITNPNLIAIGQQLRIG
jgi:lysozyme